jgi:hypothetical protein
MPFFLNYKLKNYTIFAEINQPKGLASQQTSYFAIFIKFGLLRVKYGQVTIVKLKADKIQLD